VNQAPLVPPVVKGVQDHQELMVPLAPLGSQARQVRVAHPEPQAPGAEKAGIMSGVAIPA